MKKQALVLGSILFSITGLFGCTTTIEDAPQSTQVKERKQKEQQSVALSDIERKIKQNELKATDVLALFDAKRSDEYGNAVPLKKITSVKDFKVDMERWQGRLIFHRAMQPDPYNQTEEDLDLFKAELLDNEIINDFKRLSELKSDLSPDYSLKHGKESVDDFYKNKEKTFVAYNNALVDFYDNHLKNENQEEIGFKYGALEIVHDNYLGDLIYRRLQLYQEENYLKPKEKDGSSVIGMNKTEAYRLSQDYLEFATLAENMEEAVMEGW